VATATATIAAAASDCLRYYIHNMNFHTHSPTII